MDEGTEQHMSDSRVAPLHCVVVVLLVVDIPASCGLSKEVILSLKKKRENDSAATWAVTYCTTVS